MKFIKQINKGDQPIPLISSLYGFYETLETFFYDSGACRHISITQVLRT